MKSEYKQAVFLDKDGTLIEDVPYNVDPDRMRLTVGAGEALLRLAASGYRLFVVTNQSGVARGYFKEEALNAVAERLQELLHAFGVSLDGFYYCPHHPDGVVPAYAIDCPCRKPAPGLLLRAAREHAIHLEASWCIGDILDDVEAGRRAGCRTILLANGHETEWVGGAERLPDYMARDLRQAQEIVWTVDRARQTNRAPNPRTQRGPSTHA